MKKINEITYRLNNLSFHGGSIALVFGFILKATILLLSDRFIGLGLGIDKYGDLKYVITISQLVSVVSGLGFNSSIVRFISTNINSPQLLLKVIKYILLTTFVVVFVVLGIALISKNFNNQFSNGILNNEAFTIVFTSFIFIAFNNFFIGIFSGYQKPFLKILINDIIGPFLVLISAVIFYTNSISIVNFSYLYFTSFFIVFLLNVTAFLNIARLKKIEDFVEYNSTQIKHILKSFLNYHWPICITIIIISLSTNFDRLIIGSLVFDKELSNYFSASLLANQLALVLSLVSFLYLPISSKNFKEKKFSKMMLINSFVSKWSTIIGFLPFWVLFSYGDEIIKLVWNDQFVNAFPILKVLAIAQFINISLGFTGQNLLAIGDSRSQMIIRIIGLILGIALTYFMIANFGVIGAAYAVLVSYILTNGLQIVVLFVKHNFRQYNRNYFFTVAFIVSLFGLLTICHPYTDKYNVLLRFIFELLIIFFLGYTFKIINNRDFRILKIIK